MTGVSLGREFTIYVTHVESEGPLLRIWGQIDKDAATKIESLINSLNDKFQKGLGVVQPGAILIPNTVCCAYHDDAYYRARIGRIFPNQGTVLVHFIDYGNIETVPYSSIRILNDNKEGIELQTLPVVATDFTLANVLPFNRANWDPSIVDHIKYTIRYREMPAVVSTVVKNKKRLLQLCFKHQDFAAYMIKSKMAVPATVDELISIIDPPTQSPPQQQQQSQPPYNQSRQNRSYNQPYQPHQPHQSYQQHQPYQSHQPYQQHQSHQPQHQAPDNYNNNFYQKSKPQQNYPRQQQENWRQQQPQQQLYVAPRATSQQSRPPTKPAQSLVFKNRIIEQGRTFAATVSFVDDGPLKFAVHLDENRKELDDLMERISKYPVKPLSEPPIPSTVCLGRNANDRILRRAVVMSLIDTSHLKVFYVDFGTHEILPHSDVYDLPLEFVDPCVLSVRFTLSGVRYLKVCIEMKKYFKNLVEGKRMLVEVRPPEDSPLIYYGNLIDNGVSILSLLVDKFPDCTANWPEAKKLARGAKKTVQVSCIETCSNFYIQLVEDTTALEKLTRTLSEFIQSAPPVKPASIKSGYKCLALCTVDQQWYRAQVTEVKGNEVVVHYVDYGNDESIPITALRVVGGEVLTRIPALAIHCILNGFEGQVYVEKIENKFEELVLNKILDMLVLDIRPNGLIVDLYDASCKPIINVSADLKIFATNGNMNISSPEEKSEKIISPPGSRARRSGVKSQQPLGHQQKAKPKSVKSTREESDKWKPMDQPSFEKPKKSWKDEENEQKRHDSQNYRQTNQGWTSPQQTERFTPRNDRSSRDSASRQDRNDNYERFTPDSNNRSRGGRGKPATPPRSDRNSSAEKAWSDRSDKDSDTSSRSGGRRGERGSRSGNRGRRDDFRHTPRDSGDERNFRSPRSNNYNTPERGSRDNRRSSDYRDGRKPPKIDTWDSSSASVSPKSQPLRIPPPNITLGAVKNCELVFITNPADFAVQLLPDNEELDGMMEKLSEIYENGGKIVNQSTLQVGTECVAQYSADFKWYRARVVSLEPSQAKVYFVDYGNAELVPFDKIKELQPAVAKLPAQSVRCKLLAIVEKNWSQEEVDKFTTALDMKTLEAEFVGLEDQIYETLLREIVNGVPQDPYVNEQYSNGADIIQAKEASRNKSRKIVNGRKPSTPPPDYAPLDQKWKESVINLEEKMDVMVTWLLNPYNFYCQSLKAQDEFRAMMNEIQNAYAGRQPVNEPLEVGTAVMAVFAEDGALYRAEILELNKLRGNIVRYVDFGNCAMVEARKTYRVEKRFMELPKQAFNCTLKNVVPSSGTNWSKSNSHEIDKLFNVDKLECVFHELKGNKYTVSLSTGGKDLAGIMVEKGLADFAAASSSLGQDPIDHPIALEPHLITIDISRLEGQSLRVKVSNVESAAKFHIQLPSAPDSEKTIADFMAEKDPKVLPKLSEREVFLGSGCLVDTNSGWQRAVVTNASRTTGYDVRLIDTGAKRVIPKDCMLALPPQLAVMQNQAVECYVKNANTDSKVDEKLKALIESKEVIIRVENVDNNRLAVSLFDTAGQKIKLAPNEADEKICPLLPMPVLHIVNRVNVSHINSSKSLYIQRSADVDHLEALLEDLYNYYSSSGIPLQLVEGKLCTAQSEDGNWYRAKILNKTAKGALVLYLDYGNTEDIPSNLLKELELDHMKKPQLALEVSLPVTVKGTDTEQVKALKPHLMDKEFVASLYNIRGKWIIEMGVKPGEKISDTLQFLGLVDDEVKKPEIDPNEPEEMIVGGKYKVAVTHADSPAQFWIQRLRDINAIEELQEKLQAEVSSYKDIKGIPEENLFCAAVYSGDRLWYRAEVIDADEELVTVRFVDYGNTDSIMLEANDQIKYLPDSMKSIRRYGIKCRLDLIPVGCEDWSEVACEKFSSMTASSEYVDAVVTADGTPKRVELFIDNENIGDRLVEENLAVKVHGADDLVDEIVERELDPRSAFVSHINSPSEFWVQEEKFVADLETIVDRFMVADMLPKIEEIKEGMLCVAKFPEDQAWYRARVLSHGDTGTNVSYIDYGNSAISTEVRQIPEDVAAIPPLSRKCCLPLPEGLDQWPEQACEEFTRLADEGATVFILDVLEEGETSKVRLIVDGKDISESLTELTAKSVPVIEERLSPLGEENSPNVVVSHVVSPSEFWIQADYKMADLDVMADHLANAPSFLPLNTLEEGTICAAKFPEDGLWYRAKILCHSEAETEVLYIDYGNSAVTSELRALPEDIIKIPALSMFSSLKLPEDLECWSKEACEEFIKLVADGATMFEYEEIGEDDPSLISLFINGQDVVEILAPLCEKKKPPVIDEELQNEVDKIQNLRAGACGITSEDSNDTQQIVQIETTYNEIIVNKVGEIQQTHTESISEHMSSSTSGIEVNATSDQSSMSITSAKLDSSVESTPQQTEVSGEVPGSTVSEHIEATDEIRESSMLGKELTADDIVELYSKPASENQAETKNSQQMEAGSTKGSEEKEQYASEVSYENISVVGDVQEEKQIDEPVPESKRRNSIPLEDKIILGSINKELQLSFNDTSDSTKSLSCDKSDIETADKTNLSLDLSGDVQTKEEIPSRPSTPKSPHSDKFVTDVVTDHQLLLNTDEDEVLIVETVEKLSK